MTDTHARLKAADTAGRYVVWEGPGDHLLSLNLVPHVRDAAGFGPGAPEYAQLLTRNVSGLRLYGSPDGKWIVVEACLPEKQGARLMASCSQGILRLAGEISRFRVSLCAAAWSIELAWILILADPRWAQAILGATMVLHLVLWSLTGLAGYHHVISHGGGPWIPSIISWPGGTAPICACTPIP